jgi:hypothetical protein
VLGGVLLALDVLAERPRALDRRRPHAAAATGEEELGRGGHDRPAGALEHARPECGQSSREGARLSVDVRAQVLDEVHLVDVAAPDRLAHPVDRVAVLRVAPRALPLAHRAIVRAGHVGARTPHVPHGRGCEGQGARLGRGGDARPPERLREAVAEEEVRLEGLAAGREEAALAQVRLDLLERALGRVQLEHG